MVSMIVYDSVKQEHQLLKRTVSHVAAIQTEEHWDVRYLDSPKELEDFLKEDPLLDLSCYDVADKKSIERVESFRLKYGTTPLLLIADPCLSPMEYIRPTILASSLILRPLSEGALVSNFTEMVRRMMETHQNASEEQSFVVETRDGKTIVPLSQICYFEAREKRVYLRLKNQELAFYETIENLQERIPEDFVRCHRSYIVNRSKIQKIMLSKNLLLLEGGMEVPLSRSYKQVFKESE